MPLRRAIALHLLATAVTAAAAAAPVRRTILIDGHAVDWQGVLLNAANLSVDRARYASDPDLPPVAADLRSFALTWDSEALYLYARRGVEAAPSGDTFLVCYFDLDLDSELTTADRLLVARFVGKSVAETGLYEYGPFAVADPVGGDGVTVAGGGGVLLTDKLEASVADGGVELELRVGWAELGLTPGQAFQVQPALARLSGALADVVAALPLSVADNGPVLTTAWLDVVVTPGATVAAAPGARRWFRHRVVTDGNIAGAFELELASSNGGAVELWTDPDGDGSPADGELAALDSDGDGDFFDAGDIVAQGVDKTGDGWPDTGPLATGGFVDYVLAVDAVGLAGETSTYRLTARAAGAAAIRSTATDIVRTGTVVLLGEHDLETEAGAPVRLEHALCYSGDGDEIVLTVSSLQGWPFSITVAGEARTRVAVMAGDCLDVTVVVDVASEAIVGIVEELQLVASAIGEVTAADSALDRIEVAAPVTLGPVSHGAALVGTSWFHPLVLRNASAEELEFATWGIDTLSVRTRFWTDPDGDGSPTDGQPIAATGPVAALGGELALVAQVDVSATAWPGATELTTLFARTDSGLLATVRQTTEVRQLATYGSDPPSAVTVGFPSCGRVVVAAVGFTAGTYRFRWFDASSALLRVGPATELLDGALLDDQLQTINGDRLGTWRVELERLEGAAWVGVPDGVTEFVLTDDLQATAAGGVITALETALSDYPLTGGLVTIVAELANHSPFVFAGSAIEYVIFRDVDGDGEPSPADSFMRLDGSASSWSNGDFTCRVTGLGVIEPGAGHGDSACRDLGPMAFDAAGAWRLRARWLSLCGSLIAKRSVWFNVGCSSPPAPPAGPDQVVCAGRSVRLGADDPPPPGASYHWSPAELVDDPGAARPLAWPPGTTTFTLDVVDAAGCSAADDTVIAVLPAPTVEAGPSRTICAGSAVRIGRPGSMAFDYSWSPQGGLDDPSDPRPLASPSERTTYTLTVTDPGSGCAGSDITVVDVVAPDTADAGVDGPAPAVLGPATCASELSYRWTPAEGLSDPTACNPVAIPLVDTTYCVTVTHAAGACSSGPDCVAITVPSCPQPPPAVTRLELTGSADAVQLRWRDEPAAAGGFRVYRAASKLDLPELVTAGELVAASPAGVLEATDPAPAEVAFYRVVGVCVDGVTEGP